MYGLIAYVAFGRILFLAAWLYYMISFDSIFRALQDPGLIFSIREGIVEIYN